MLSRIDSLSVFANPLRVPFIFIFLSLFIYLREREKERACACFGERQRGNPSNLCAVRAEPEVGLELMNHEIMT